LFSTKKIKILFFLHGRDRPRPSIFFTGIFGRWRDRARFLTFTDAQVLLLKLLTDFKVFGTILLRGFKAILSTPAIAQASIVAKNIGIKFSTAMALLKMTLQIITLSETMIVHKAVRGAISKQCIEWRSNGIWGRLR
jgi:hypothetical protein